MKKDILFQTDKKVIVLTGGGTAGHVMPNLALLPSLKKHFDEVHYIGTDGMEKGILSAYPEVIYHTITAVKLDRGAFFKNLLIPFRLFRAVGLAKRVLKRVKPCVVFSKGGFVALPVALAARCPVITHESDLSLGLANKIAAKKSSKLLSIFPIEGATAVGAPLREEIFRGNRNRALTELGFLGGRPVLLVMGGSLGALAVNRAVREALSELTRVFDVVHLTGKGGKADDLESSAYRQLEFSNRIWDIYAAADIVVSRAGAGSVTELGALKKPTLLIPLPKGGSRGDQIENAAFMQSKGFMNVLHQPLTTERLVSAVDATWKNRAALSAALATHSFNGTQRIVDEILKISSPNK